MVVRNLLLVIFLFMACLEHYGQNPNTVFDCNSLYNVEGMKIGEKAPQFSGIDQDARPIVLSSILKYQNKNVLLMFYRSSVCPNAQQQIAELQKKIEGFESKNTKVIAVTTEPMEKIIETTQKNKITFSVIHDGNHRIMDAYKSSIKLSEAQIKPLLEQGGQIEKNVNEDFYTIPIPVIYLISRHDQRIKAVFVSDKQQLVYAAEYIQSKILE